MNKSMLFSAVILTSAAFADGEFFAVKMDNNSQHQMNSSPMMNHVILTSARPESDNGWYVFADALYWHVDIGSTDWASVNDFSNTSNPVVKNHSLDFKWNWGFRVGIGANINHDMWDTNLYYTWLFADNSNSAGGANLYLTDQFNAASAISILNSGSIKWDVHFSMFDWELGRWYYVSKNLAVRPHTGVKGGWINQKVHTIFSGPAVLQTPAIVYSEHFKNNFWGVGPLLGVNTLWVLGNAGAAMDHRFSLFSDFGGALMYGHFNVTNQSTSTTLAGTQSSVYIKNLTRNLATAMLQGLFGLSWDTAFNQGKNHFMMKLGYEFQYWFRQNQLVTTVAQNRPTGGFNFYNRRISDDLALQGVTAEFRFDF